MVRNRRRRHQSAGLANGQSRHLLHSRRPAFQLRLQHPARQRRSSMAQHGQGTGIHHPVPHTGNNQYRLPRRTGKRIQLHVLHPPEKRRFHLRKHQRRPVRFNPENFHPYLLLRSPPTTSPLSKSRKINAKRPKRRRYNSTVC